jgi:hypothetical protein
MRPLKETLQFLIMVLIKTSSGIGHGIIWYMVTNVLKEKDPPMDGGSKIL